MKRFAVLLLTLALAVCCTLPAFAADTIEVNEDVSVSGDYDWTRFKGQNITLNVYNWGEYISNGSDDSLDVVSAFEDLTGIKVNYTTFDSNESMYAKLKSGAADYDVVIPSDYMVAKMIAEGMLKPLNYDNIPNFQKIDAEYRNPDYDPQNAYTVPYMLCTTGIIYNTTMVDEEIDSWDALWDEKYENKQYTFTIAGIYDQCVNIAVFMPIENYRMVFELDEEAFSGYFSNEELTDLSEDDIATVITERDITKMCDQLDHSMGSYMDYFQILCILLSAVLIYLLTKLIIEKNENAISMTKILGYENKEIASLYLLSTTIVVVIEDAVSVVLGAFVMNLAWKAILFSYSGWFAFVIQPAGYVKMFAFVLIGYLFVMILDFMRIKKIPMDQALKNVE
mgnify:CR=1 FL=1